MPCTFTRVNKLMIVLLAGLRGGAGFPRCRVVRDQRWVRWRSGGRGASMSAALKDLPSSGRCSETISKFCAWRPWWNNGANIHMTAEKGIPDRLLDGHGAAPEHLADR